MREKEMLNKSTRTLPAQIVTFLSDMKNSTDLRDRLTNVWIVPEIKEELPIHERMRPMIDVGASRNCELLRLICELPVHIRDDSKLEWYVDNEEYMI